MGEPIEYPVRWDQARLAVAIALPLVLLFMVVSILAAFICKRRRPNRVEGSEEPLLSRGEDPAIISYAIDLPCLRGRSCLGGRLCLNRNAPRSPVLPHNEVNENENLDV